VEFKKDPSWWSKFLDKFNGVSYIPDMVWANPDVNFSTDACKTRAGGWSDKEFYSCQFPEFVLKFCPHINQLELWAILIGLKIWQKKFVDRKIQVFCDNSASVTVINTGRSKDTLMLRILREMALVAVQNNFEIRAVHLPGVSNRRADILSRNAGSMNLEAQMGPEWCRIDIPDSMFVLRDYW